MILPFAEGMSERKLSARSFVMTSLAHITDNANEEEMILRGRDEYRLMLILQGKPVVSINEWQCPSEPGSCLLVSPNESITIKRNGSAYTAYILSFAIVTGQGSSPIDVGTTILELFPKYVVLPLHTLLSVVEDEDTSDSSNPSDPVQSAWAELHQQHRFLALLTELLKGQHVEKSMLFNVKKKVQDTIIYIEQNYAFELSVQSLADMASLPRWQYLRVFKQLTGNTPSNYITHIRIEKAKQLLQQPEGKVWEIAHQVGYQDEQYFNRRFKQVTGTSPGEYARMHNTVLYVTDWRGNRCSVPVASKRIIYDDPSTLGDLLALGISPVGANMRHYNITEQLQETKEIGFPLDLNKVRELNPDLVLLSRFGYEHFEPISQISSIVGLNEYAPMDRRIQKLGEILDMRHEAQAWIKSYHERSEIMWEKLQSRKAPNETAAILYYSDNGNIYFLHRRRGIAKILYHPLGFRMNDKLGQLRPQRGNYYITVDPERIGSYTCADRLFIFYRHTLTESRVKSELQILPEWGSIPAVTTGKVHYLHESWNGDDALVSEAILQQFPDLWV